MLLFIVLFLLLEAFEPKTIVVRPGNCGPGSYTVLYTNESITCLLCLYCPPGFGTPFQCGSFLKQEELGKMMCEPCPIGTFSDFYSSSPCKRCKRCTPGSVVRRNCTSLTDTECASEKFCKPGYYYSKILFACLPCSRCCDDAKDIKIDECATQGSQSNKLCSVRSLHRCLKDVDAENATSQSLKKTTLSSSKTNTTTSYLRENKKTDLETYGSEEMALVCFSLGALLFLSIIIILVSKIKCAKKNSEVQCFPQMRLSKSKSIPDKCDQSDELEDFSNNDISRSEYSFKCGGLIKYNPDCKQDRYKNLIVEPLCDECVASHLIRIKEERVFLSPIYRFYSRGEQFENKVKVSLPHSALWNSEQKNWDIDILVMDERKGKETKWEKITDGVEVNWKDASFYTDTLLTYAVVGKPMKGAKKRMQFVLFTTAEMISDRFEVCIYLLDDNESSFQNILKESSSKGLTMLGSFYAVFVDCYSPVDINLKVDGLLNGWELAYLDQKCISSSVCKESYFSIPSFQAAFRRVKRHADRFSCKFRINVAENEIIIPAFTFVPEEEFSVVVDVHDQGYDTSVIKEKTSLFKDLDYDTKYVAGRMLDVSLKGQGTWRQLGRHFGLADDKVEKFSLEYRTLEGSPSRALFDYLSTEKPEITVGEFAKCLESLGREDVSAIICKHLKAKKPVNIV